MRFHAIYIEEEVEDHPLTQFILEHHPKIPHITCQRYGEVFNRKAQNFRIQKQNPALILAKKHSNFILKTPEGYGIGGKNNYYFSHMLNCVFDCRYCFLQGMYQSAHYVVFINFEDFHEAILEKLHFHSSEKVYFFSGYDCDSLALESVTHFVEKFLPLFQKHPQGILELRTKSTNVNFLLKSSPMDNLIIAYSLTPREIGKALENKTPGLDRRLEALRQLQNQGWLVGVRFDPIIYCDSYRTIYKKFFKEVFDVINENHVHSVTMGPFRLPRGIYKNMFQLYPDEKLFAHSLKDKNGIVTYHDALETELLDFCRNEVSKYISNERFFPCEVNV